MSPFARATIIAVLALAPPACTPEPSTDAPPLRGAITIDDVQFAGHGALFDTNGEYLPVDLSVAAALQASLLDALLEGGGAPENAAQIRAFLAEARDAQLAGTDLLVLRDMMIAWRLAFADTPLRAVYQTRAIALHLVTEALLKLSMRKYFVTHPTLADLVGVRIVHFHEMLFPLPRPDLTLASYEDRCAGLGIPVPPPLSDPDWERVVTAQTPLHLPSFLA